MNAIRIPGAVWIATPGLIGVLITTWLQIAYPEHAVAVGALIMTALAAITGVVKLIVDANTPAPVEGAETPGAPRGLASPQPEPKQRSAVSRFLF